MTLSQAEITKLIQDAQAGDACAKNQLIQLIQDNGYMKAVSRYLHANRLLEPDDVKSEFWLGVVLALPKVRTDIGNPLFYLAWKGANRVRAQLRINISKGVQFTCLECGYVGRLYRKDGEYKCKKCGSTEYKTYQNEINITTLLSNTEKDETEITTLLVTTPPETNTTIDFEYIRGKLAPREQEVITLIYKEYIDKGSVRNYLKEIGERMNISAQCVLQYIKRIRHKLEHLREEME